MTLDRVRENLSERATGHDLFDPDMFSVGFLLTKSPSATLPTTMSIYSDLQG